MTYEEVIENAKGTIGKYCKACAECTGRVCKNQIPGPGAKGVGDTAIRNYEKWKEIRINLFLLLTLRFLSTFLFLLHFF